MNTAGPLAGKTIVVTRPLAQAGTLATGIEAAGGRALIFPLLDISPPADSRALNEAITHLNAYAFAIFISPNAVDYSLPSILKCTGWPDGLQAAAIGPGTVKALAAHGVTECLAPKERFDSEGLLAEAAFDSTKIAGKKIVIFRGNGGRELLADTLLQRGAQVDCITCYQRSAPSDISPLVTAWDEGRLDALTLSSSEALRHLLDRLDETGREKLRQTPVFVPHPRIAETANACGLRNIILTEAADTGILAGLRAYNWHIQTDIPDKRPIDPR